MLELPPNDQRYLEAVETLPRGELLQLQWRRLQEMISYAYERSAFVRHHWDAAGLRPADIRSSADYTRLAPLMDKDQMREWRDTHDDPFCGLLCTDVAAISFMGSSSGTTGDPTLFSYRWGRADGNLPAAPGLPADGPSSYWGGTLRDWWEIGLRPGEHAVYFGLRMRGPMFRLLQTLGLTPIMLGYGPDDLHRFIDLSRRYRPTVFYAMTAYLGVGLQEIERTLGVDMRDVFASYKGVLFAGEPVGPRLRQTFERWGLADKIYNQTSFGDIGHAHDCREHDGCHAWEDIGVAEIIDPETGAPIEGDGRGELVGDLAREPGRSAVALPRRRHRRPAARDLRVRPHARALPSGRPQRRRGHCRGRSILPMDVWGAIEDVPETSSGLFQIIRPQRMLDALKIRVGYIGEPDLRSLQGRVADSVESAIGLRPTVELVPNAVIMQSGSRHKIRAR